MRDSPAQWCWPRRRDLVPIRLLRCLERGTLGVATDEGVTRDCYAGFTNCESRPARGPRRPKRGAPTPSGPWASAVAGMRRLSPHQMTPTGTRLPDGYHQELEDHRPSSRGGSAVALQTLGRARCGAVRGRTTRTSDAGSRRAFALGQHGYGEPQPPPGGSSRQARTNGRGHLCRWRSPRVEASASAIRPSGNVPVTCRG
jgi:hypothetical protein